MELNELLVFYEINLTYLAVEMKRIKCITLVQFNAIFLLKQTNPTKHKLQFLMVAQSLKVVGKT